MHIHNAAESTHTPITGLRRPNAALGTNKPLYKNPVNGAGPSREIAPGLRVEACLWNAGSASATNPPVGTEIPAYR